MLRSRAGRSFRIETQETSPRGVRHRHRRQPRQTAWPGLSRRRDLRRDQIGMGLRAVGRGAQGEHQAAVVARGGHRPRRRRRPGLVDHSAARGVGRLGTCRGLQRPTGGMPELPQAAPAGPHAGGLRTQEGRATGRRADERDRLPRLRHQRSVDRAARIQHDAQDVSRPDRDRRGAALSAARDRAGHLRQLRQRGDDRTPQAAVRHLCGPRPRRASSSTSPTW